MDTAVKVLLIDDYLPVRRTIRDLLRQIGFRSVEDTGDVDKALAKLHEAPFGLVICDWMMEPVSGIELLKQIRSDEKLKDTPFIMVTAKGTKVDVMEAMEAGVNDFIVKPFNLRTLKSKVETVLDATEHAAAEKPSENAP